MSSNTWRYQSTVAFRLSQKKMLQRIADQPVPDVLKKQKKEEL